MAATTPLQDALLDELPQMQDYDRVVYHLFNDQDVQEDHEQFWRRALRAYCEERGVLGACMADIYRDFTLPFVIPGDADGFQPHMRSSDSMVKVYPESLEKCLIKLRQSKDILSGSDLKLPSPDDINVTSNGSGGKGWIKSAITTVIQTLSPTRQGSANDTLLPDAPLVPTAILQDMSKSVLHWSQKVKAEGSPDSYDRGQGSSTSLVYYLHNPDANQLYERSLEETDQELRPGPLTITSLLHSINSLMEKEEEEANSVGQSVNSSHKDAPEGTSQRARALFRKLTRPPSALLSHGASSTKDLPFVEALIAFMLDNDMAAMSMDGTTVKLLPLPSSLSSSSSSSSSCKAGDRISTRNSQTAKTTSSGLYLCDQRDTALLSTHYTLSSLRWVARDTERKIEQKTAAARSYLRRANEAGKAGNSKSQMSLTKITKMQLSLRGQLQRQFDTALSAMMKLESALLLLESQEVQQRVLDSIQNATVTLRTLREGDEHGQGRVMMTAEEAQQLLEDADEELEQNQVLAEEVRVLMEESVEGGPGTGDGELEEELAALMGGVSLSTAAAAAAESQGMVSVSPQEEEEGEGTRDSVSVASELPLAPSHSPHAPTASAPAATPPEAPQGSVRNRNKDNLLPA